MSTKDQIQHEAIDRPLVTTWSAQRAHIDSGVRTYRTDFVVTACGREGVAAGEGSSVDQIEQSQIDALPRCGQCARRRGHQWPDAEAGEGCA